MAERIGDGKGLPIYRLVKGLADQFMALVRGVEVERTLPGGVPTTGMIARHIKGT